MEETKKNKQLTGSVETINLLNNMEDQPFTKSMEEKKDEDDGNADGEAEDWKDPVDDYRVNNGGWLYFFRDVTSAYEEHWKNNIDKRYCN